MLLFLGGTESHLFEFNLWYSFVGPELYKFMSLYLMTNEQLAENGYPRPNPEVAGSAIVKHDPKRLPPKNLSGVVPLHFKINGFNKQYCFSVNEVNVKRKK